MANLNGFNASEVEPTVPYEPLPANNYSTVMALVAANQTAQQGE